MRWPKEEGTDFAGHEMAKEEAPPSLAILWPKRATPNTAKGEGMPYGLRERAGAANRLPNLWEGAGSPHPNRFHHTTPTSPTFPQHPPTGKNVGKSITDWQRTSYEAISPLPQHFPFFRWPKKEKKTGVGGGGREEEK
jgi:hypothetical protein